MMAGSDTGNGFASSLTETCLPALSLATIARRVGSDSAAKVRSMRSELRSEYLTIWLSVGAAPRDVNPDTPGIVHEAVWRNLCDSPCETTPFLGSRRWLRFINAAGLGWGAPNHGRRDDHHFQHRLLDFDDLGCRRQRDGE